MSDNESGSGSPKQIRKACSGAHVFEWVTSNYLYYVKGTRERYWFRGKYAECQNIGCEETKFMGDRKPYYQDVDGDAGPDNVMLEKKQEAKNGSES